MSKKYDFSEREWFVICTALFGNIVMLRKENDIYHEVESWNIVSKVLPYLAEDDRAFVEQQLAEAEAE